MDEKCLGQARSFCTSHLDHSAVSAARNTMMTPPRMNNNPALWDFPTESTSESAQESSFEKLHIP